MPGKIKFTRTSYGTFLRLTNGALSWAKCWLRGIAICRNGVGASVCANKVVGVRAGLVHDHFSAQQGVQDDNMNVICMGGRTVGPAVAWDLVEAL